jgi:4-aminobutyrate aminotransferase-like enzyme
VLQILQLFKMQTGHQHPHVGTAFGNYLALLKATGQTDIDPEAIRQSLLEELQSRIAG